MTLKYKKKIKLPREALLPTTPSHLVAKCKEKKLEKIFPVI